LVEFIVRFGDSDIHHPLFLLNRHSSIQSTLSCDPITDFWDEDQSFSVQLLLFLIHLLSSLVDQLVSSPFTIDGEQSSSHSSSETGLAVQLLMSALSTFPWHRVSSHVAIDAASHQRSVARLCDWMVERGRVKKEQERWLNPKPTGGAGAMAAMLRGWEWGMRYSLVDLLDRLVRNEIIPLSTFRANPVSTSLLKDSLSSILHVHRRGHWYACIERSLGGM
jgi:hypothetical protein